MPYELFIAKRYLGTRRKTGFINIITYISVIGVTIGVAALIIVLSVMNGFESEVRSRIIGFDAHLRIRGFYDQGLSDWKGVSKEIQDVDHIVGLSPYILDKGMLRYIGSAKSSGVIIRGADQTNINEVSDLENNIVEGYLELGPAMEENGREIPGIVVGMALKDQLSLNLGDRILIMSLAGVRTAFSDIPMKQFVVTGVYETGFFEYDNARPHPAETGAFLTAVKVPMDNP